MAGASEAFLLGDFNKWNPENAPKLEKQKDGSFSTVAKLEEGKTYHYRFLLNDGRWVNDYNAQSYTNAHGLHVDNCVITVPVSKTEETKKAQPVKDSATKEAKVEAKAPVAAKSETVAAKPAKKAAPAKATETKAPAAKTVKAAAPKATPAKPVAAAKKAATKAKK